MFCAAAVVVALFGGGQISSLGGGFPTAKTEEKPEPVLSTSRFAPAAWSPTRNELAFGGWVGGADGVIPPGWLLPVNPDSQSASKENRRQAIWVLPPGESKAELIASTVGVFSAPTWAPDGESLFYVQWEPAANGQGTVTLKRHFRDGKSQTITREIGRFAMADRLLLPFETISVSPDGILVAAPWMMPKGLAIVDLETNRVVRRLQQTSGPAWSPDSGTLAYFAAESSSSGLLGFGSATKNKQRNPAQLMVASRTALLEGSSQTPVGKSTGLFDGSQPARWDQTGHTLLALRSMIESAASFEPSRVLAYRISVSDGRAAKVYTAASGEVKGPPLLASFAFDPRNETMILAAVRADARMMFDRFELSGSQFDAPWHPFDETDASLPSPLGSLALSEDGKRLAFRFGKPELGAPIAIWNLDGDRTTPIHTDDAGDLRTAAVFTASARRTLLQVAQDNAFKFQMTWPGAWDSGREHPQRLNPFPRLERLEALDEHQLLRVRQLAARGLEFIGKRPPARDSVSAKRFDELALQLHYLREEFGPALKAIDRLTADEAATPERRLMLAVLRAQCLEASAGSRMAKLSLESLLESSALKGLRVAEDDEGLHPLLKRIEEILGGTKKSNERPGDEDLPDFSSLR